MSEKHLVCQGAKCKCQFGTAPDTLKVLTQTKHYINDRDGAHKLTATHKDIGQTFEKNTFGNCAKANNKPCQPAVTQWDGYYEKIVLTNNGKVLLEDSKATCAVAGTACIEILFHGQTVEFSRQNVEHADENVLAAICPFVNFKAIDQSILLIPQIPE